MQPPAFQEARCGTAHAGAVIEFCQVTTLRARSALMVELMRRPNWIRRTQNSPEIPDRQAELVKVLAAAGITPDEAQTLLRT